MVNDKVKKAILTTLLYSDIFDYPLSKDELWRFLISKEKIDKVLFNQAVKDTSHVSQKNGLYCLKGKEWTIEKRKKAAVEVQKKFRIAKKAAECLSYIPSISFIGMSGSMAIGNVNEEDDIDFFIITKKNTLFMTRIWVLALLEAMKLRRSRTDKQWVDKICVNLLVDETELHWDKYRHDLFIAHEIAHLKPLFERHGMFNKFLAHNEWVKKIYPNVFLEQQVVLGNNWKSNVYTLKAISSFFTIYPFELIVRILQKIKMKKHQTNEIVSNTLLSFYPNDYRSRTLRLLRKKSLQLGLLTI